MTQVGSPLFAAPEVYSKDRYSAKVDIWGVGIVALLLLVSEASGFEDTNISEKYEKIHKLLNSDSEMTDEAKELLVN